MVFASPIWLLALLPWGAVVALLLPGRGVPMAVPFVRFWKTSTVMSRRRGWRRPSPSVVLMLLALLLAVLAAAKPDFPGDRAIAGEVSIIFDRGKSLAVPSASGQAFRGVLRECVNRVGSLSSRSRVVLIPVPGESVELTGDGWLSVAGQLHPTVLRTDLGQAIANQLQRTTGPVVVLSDQSIDRTNPRIIQILPEPAEDCVAITHFSARSFPHAQALVRIENHSDRRTIHLTVGSANHITKLDTALPPRGKSIDCFVSLDGLEQSVTAEISPGVAGNPWAVAYAFRQSPGIEIAVDAAMEDAIKRIATIYQKDRPAGPGSRQIVISNQAIPAGQSGIWIHPGALMKGQRDTPRISANEITQNLTDWPAAGSDDQPPEGFSAVVSMGRSTIVALRQEPNRQVWLNADLSDWQERQEFVIFFANVFAWLGGDDARWTAKTPQELGGSWRESDRHAVPPGLKPGEWPGISDDPETGKRVATNAGSFPRMGAIELKNVHAGLPRDVAGKMQMQTIAILSSLLSLTGALLALNRRAAPR